MRRVKIIVETNQAASPFMQRLNDAIAAVILDHQKNGRDTYGMRNGKIVVRKPDGRILDVEEEKFGSTSTTALKVKES